VLIPDDGWRAVFIHDLLDHIGFGRLPVLRKCEVSGDEISAVGARRRGEAARKHFACLFGPAGKLKISAAI